MESFEKKIETCLNREQNDRRRDNERTTPSTEIIIILGKSGIIPREFTSQTFMPLCGTTKHENIHVIPLYGGGLRDKNLFSEQIKGMAGFRNILIHEYLLVRPEEVYKNLQKGPQQFDQLSKHIHAFLERETKK